MAAHAKNFLKERCGRTEWDPVQECFYWIRGVGQRRQRLRGLTRYLKERFYPHARLIHVRGTTEPHLQLGQSLRRGRAGGSFVHQELCSYINEGLEPRDPRVTRILQLVRSRGWVPIVSELPVGDGSIGVGTAVDLVCIHPDSPSVYHIIEIKTGYERNYTLAPPSSRCRKPMNRVPTSPWGQHQLQLLGTRELLIRHGVPIGISEIWCVGREKIRRFPLLPCLQTESVF